MLKVVFACLTLLALSACQKGPLLGPGDADNLASEAQADCGFVQNAYGQRVSWKKDIPVTLYIDPQYPLEFHQALARAAKHWNDAAGLTLILLKEPVTSFSEKNQKDKTNTFHWMNEWDESKSTLQGLTSLYWTGSQLTEADVAINNKNFTYYIDTFQNVQQVHLESLLVHELGHVLGLKHRSTVPSVMWAILNGGVDRSILTAADRETIKCEY